MTCVKTGCHIYIIPYGEYAYGDAHEVDGVYFFRLVETSDKPTGPVIHYELNGYDTWWDKSADHHRVSTLVAMGRDVLSYGYEGRPLVSFPHLNGGNRND